MANKTFITGENVKSLVKMEYDGDVIFEGIFASNDRDIQGDIIDKTMLKQMNNNLNTGAPVFLNHFYHRPAVGKVLKSEYMEDPNTGRAWIWGRGVVDSADADFKRQVADGRYKYISVGGHLDDYEMEKSADGKSTRRCKSGKALEISLTAVPINISAGMTLAKGQINDEITDQIIENNNLMKAIFSMDEDEQGKLTKLNYHEVEFIPISEQSMLQKGEVGEFKKLDEKPSKSSIEFGHGTKVGEEDLEKYYNPKVSGFITSKDVDPLNVSDEHSQEFLSKHKTSVIESNEKHDDFGFVDKNSESFLNKTSISDPAAPNKYDPGNSVDKNSNSWILSQAKTFVSGLDSMQKAVLVDLIFHDFNTDKLYATSGESQPNVIHRLLHQKNSYAKAGGFSNIIGQELTALLKSLDWRNSDNNMYDRLVLDHILGPNHIEEVKDYLTKSMYGFAGDKDPNEPDGDEMGQDPSMGGSPMGQDPSMGGAPMGQDPSMGGAPAMPAPGAEGTDPSMGGGEDPTIGAVSQIVEKYAQQAGIDPNSIQQLLQGGDVTGAAKAVIQALQQSNPDLANQMLDELNQTLQGGGSEQATPGGGEAPGAAPQSMMMGKSINPEEAVAAYREARKEQFTKSRVFSEQPAQSRYNSKPASGADLAMASWIGQYNIER